MRTNEEVKEMLNCIIADFPSTDVDITLERLTEIGHCPSLVYDDNGHWAIGYNGTFSVRHSPDADYKGSVYIETECFKPTIREAVEYYIMNLKTE